MSNHGYQDGADINGEADIVSQLMRTAGRRPAPPPEAYRKALEAATAAWQAKLRRRRRWRLLAGAAAAAILTASLGMLLTSLPSAPRSTVAEMERIIGSAEMLLGTDEDWTVLRDETRALSAGSALRTSAGSLAGLLLADGTSLRLAEHTEVRLESESQIRLVAGRVYLDTGIGGGETSRVRVETPVGSATDVGTQFEVRYRDEAYRLRVREGEVLLRRGSEEIDNAAGEQLTIDRSGTISRTRISRDDPDWQWVESVAPAPDIDGQPVTVLLDWVARETGRPITFAAPATEHKATETILHGTIRHLAPLEALDVLLATTDFEYAITEDGTILIRSKLAR